MADKLTFITSHENMGGHRSAIGIAGESLVAEATISIKGHFVIEHGPRCTSEMAHYKSSEG